MQPFSEIYFSDFTKLHIQKIKNEILSKGKNYILQVDENEFIEYLLEKYNVEPLKIIFESENISEPIKIKETRNNDFLGRQFEIEGWSFKITYQFTGNAELFKVRPNPYTFTNGDISVSGSTVSFQIKIFRQDPAEFNRQKSDAYSEAFTNLDKLNDNLQQISGSFEGSVRLLFHQEKAKYKNENDFFAAINVKIDNDTKSVFSAPTIKKKDIPQPQISKNREFASEPTMSKSMYDDILKVIYDFGKSMEKKPSTYQGKNEEALRDQFLVLLETRYDSTTATGETFNKSGKTDIILKYANDGSNLFVAECKFWHGNAEFQKAISQLFDRYLTWRDSKVALIFFVNKKDFSKVITTIKSEAKSHSYFVKELSSRGETSFSYIFHLPVDSEKEVQLEIITFHFN